MGFFRKDSPRWVEALDWTPERPFGFEPDADNDAIGWIDEDALPEPQVAVPEPEALPEPPPLIPEPSSEEPSAPSRHTLDLTPRVSLEPRATRQPVPMPDALPSPPEPVAQAMPEPREAPLPRSATARYSTARLAIGLVQGLGLYALFQSRAHGGWPGHDPLLFAAISFAALFAPLVLLEGLGEVPVLLLALWTAIVAAVLASLGMYHRIQGPQQVHAGIALVVLTVLMLVTAQALLRIWSRSGKPGYRIYFDATWTLIARLLIWSAITGLAWALVGSGNSLFNWMRAHYPAFRPAIDPQMLIMPLVALASAAAFDMTASGSASKRFARKALLACWTVALPLLIAGAAILLTTHLFVAPVGLIWSLGLSLLLLAAVNASYRGDRSKGRWRKDCEFAGSFLILVLAFVAAQALHLRVESLGWTATRIYIAGAVAMVGLYGLLYAGAAVISIGGGRWMQRVEIINPLMAMLLVAVCLALASPLADPLKLAVNSQAARLERGAVDPALFDFGYLRGEGVRFGQVALADMVHSPDPYVARGAAVALSAPPGTEAPSASEIGANITVRTRGARLPGLLLAHDWSLDKAAVPPCLTRPAMTCDAWFLDLDRDGTNEILLVWGSDARWWATVMKNGAKGWRPAASFASPGCRGSLSAMRAGNLYAVDPAPTWQDLLVAGFRLTAKAAPKADLPCPR